MLALLLLAAASAPALAPPPAIVPAPPDPLGDLALRRALADPAESRSAGARAAGAIVVCGRAEAGGRLSLPWQPDPGARVRLIAGEAARRRRGDGRGRVPEALRAAGDDRPDRRRPEHRHAIGRGIGSLLHPD